MYVRWKKRPSTRTTRHQGPHITPEHALACVLVECRRVNGRPRQRFLAHLGTIRFFEIGVETRRCMVPIGTGGHAQAVEIIAFWDRLARKLDNIDGPFDRDAVEAMVSAQIPRPDDEMRARV